MTRVLFVSDAAQDSDHILGSWASALGLAPGDWALVHAAAQSTNGEAPSYEVFEARRPMLKLAISKHQPKVIIALGNIARSALLMAGVRPYLRLTHPAWFARAGKSPATELEDLKTILAERLAAPRIVPCARCAVDPNFGTYHEGCRACTRIP